MLLSILVIILVTRVSQIMTKLLDPEDYNLLRYQTANFCLIENHDASGGTAKLCIRALYGPEAEGFNGDIDVGFLLSEDSTDPEIVMTFELMVQGEYRSVGDKSPLVLQFTFVPFVTSIYKRKSASQVKVDIATIKDSFERPVTFPIDYNHREIVLLEEDDPYSSALEKIHRHSLIEICEKLFDRFICICPKDDPDKQRNASEPSMIDDRFFVTDCLIDAIENNFPHPNEPNGYVMRGDCTSTSTSRIKGFFIKSTTGRDKFALKNVYRSFPVFLLQRIAMSVLLLSHSSRSHRFGGDLLLQHSISPRSVLTEKNFGGCEVYQLYDKRHDADIPVYNICAADGCNLFDLHNLARKIDTALVCIAVEGSTMDARKLPPGSIVASDGLVEIGAIQSRDCRMKANTPSLLGLFDGFECSDRKTTRMDKVIRRNAEMEHYRSDHLKRVYASCVAIADEPIPFVHVCNDLDATWLTMVGITREEGCPDTLLPKEKKDELMDDVMRAIVHGMEGLLADAHRKASRRR